ncbi:hypothetical protein RX327_17245 [Bradyrhizobium sp. BEA-2-5]|uniref:hypothetical protein n=1 Tax=Bradyrhizobium TaxID=374 RepID=UPI00067E0A74|nr:MULTISPECIES: hypothetical protein [Bradyrhizobium]WOH84748.1 hypothetical protein RX327_17245 [Bradyrhizobium sp. BEA-2-5]
MTTLRIHDDCNGALALDLRDLIDLLAPRSLQASWMVSPVVLHHPVLGRALDEFMVAGEHQLEAFAAKGTVVSGAALSKAAREASQVIWGQFVGTLPEQDDTWIMIRAVDSTFYEVTSSDEAVLGAIRSAYKDVRIAAGPVTSSPISPV